MNIWPFNKINQLQSDLALAKQVIADQGVSISFLEQEKNKWISCCGEISKQGQKDSRALEAAKRDIELHKGEIVDLKAEVSSLTEALRIADERADKNAAACDAAHDCLGKALPPPGFAAILDDGAPAFKANLVRTKVGATPKRTATAPGGAKLVLRADVKTDDGAEAAYAKRVEGEKS